MTEVSVGSLIESFKKFIEGCSLTIEFPQQFIKKWSIYSYYLDSYPQNSHKLIEYSKKCSDSQLEKQFIEENLKNADVQWKLNYQSQLSPNRKKKELKKVGGKSNQIQTNSFQTQPFKENLSELLKLAMMQIKQGSQQFIEKQKFSKPQEFYKESFIVSNDVIKKIDANQLRQKILIQMKPTKVRNSANAQYPQMLQQK